VDFSADVEHRGDLVQADVEVIGDDVPVVLDGAGLDLGDPSVRVLTDISQARHVRCIVTGLSYTPDQYSIQYMNVP
jgi:hypothetical protein